jgi:hypothetical protein
MSEELGFILRNTLNWNFVEILPISRLPTKVGWEGGGTYAFDPRVDERNLFLDGERGVLSLLQEFLETFSTVKSLFC